MLHLSPAFAVVTLLTASVTIALANDGPADATRPRNVHRPMAPGTITGRVLFSGPHPDRKRIELAPPRMAQWKADGYSGNSPHRPSWCSIHFDRYYRNVAIHEESLVIGEDGGIANVFVYMLRPPPKLIGSVEAAQTIQRMEISHGRFEPHAMIVSAGKKFVVENLDATGWNEISFVGINNNSGVLTMLGKPPSRIECVFQAEKLPMSIRGNVNCWMTGIVLAVDHPWASLTDGEGRFRIDNVPAGKWEFAFWHERTGWLKTNRFPTGKTQITIAKDPINLGDVTAPSTVFERN